MKINKKIKGYTLNELLIVLIISSIIISLTFELLLIIKSEIKEIRKNISIIQNSSSLEKILWNDFNQYNLNYRNNTLNLKSYTDSITYIFDYKYIIRKNDTFRIKTINKELFLDGKKIKSGDVDAIKITIEPDIILFIYKTKDASYYINKHGF